IRRYWKCEFPTETDPRSDTELARELWARLKDATEARLMADVPVGVFLSGGLDSSCIAAQMIDLRKERGEGPVKSFSVGYRTEDGSSELDQARMGGQVARDSKSKCRVFAVAPFLRDS